MTRFTSALALAAALGLGAAGTAPAQDNPMVGGAPMYANMNIVENAVNSADHTTLVAAVQAAGLVDTLSSPGPFTVFAPTNAAFGDLPAGTVDTLLMEENLGQLQKVLTAHVVPGNYSSAELWEMAAANGGSFGMLTASGDTLGFQIMGDSLIVVDESRNAARITIADVNQSNGVIHVVDSVLVPE